MSHSALISETSAWNELRAHRQRLRRLLDEEGGMRQVFARDPSRAERYSVRAAGLYLDYSKHLLDDAALASLLQLAQTGGVEPLREQMFAGQRINTSEDRQVLHVALRHLRDSPFPSGSEDVMPEVRAARERMRDVADSVRQGRWLGHDGTAIDTVVNLGIGGSDLGPAMAVCALSDAAPGKASASPRVFFVSNVDGAGLAKVLRQCEPRRTLFIVASKSFSTQETLLNARSARQWILDAFAGDERSIARHFFALSTQLDRTDAFGIAPENVLGFWDWVGGRYSVWSPIGLSVAIAVGYEPFEAMLRGAAAMDEHFRTAPAAENMPLLMGLLAVWYRCFWSAATHAVLPYDVGLELLPAYLQQLEMESNGKQVTRDGARCDYPTGPIIWGGLGNNGQHAYYQLLHQTPELVPCDLLVPVRSQLRLPGHELATLANALGQAEALMRGQRREDVERGLRDAGYDGEALERAIAHRLMPGNKPSSMLVYERLGPEQLGALVALYEHRVLVQSAIFGINAFDQWGVELGKRLAADIEGVLQRTIDRTGQASAAGELSSSTQRLIEMLAAKCNETD